jgi:hypothetical protein
MGEEGKKGGREEGRKQEGRKGGMEEGKKEKGRKGEKEEGRTGGWEGGGEKGRKEGRVAGEGGRGGREDRRKEGGGREEGWKGRKGGRREGYHPISGANNGVPLLFVQSELGGITKIGNFNFSVRVHQNIVARKKIRIPLRLKIRIFRNLD